MFYKDPKQLERILAGVEAVYNSDRWSNGYYTEQFSTNIREHIGVSKEKTVLATTNGTASIRIAIKALGLKDSGIILVPELTAPAVWFGISEAKNIKSYSVESYWVPSMQEVLSLLNAYEGSGPKVLYVVHTGGLLIPNIRQIRMACTEFNIILIEDISHAQGSVYGGIIAGAYGDIVLGSMYATKSLNAGEGGFIAYDSKFINIYKAWNAGRNDREEQFLEIGDNARPSEFQAVVMNEIAKEYPQVLKYRKECAWYYDSHLDIPLLHKHYESYSYYKYIVIGKPENIASVLMQAPKGAMTGTVHNMYIDGLKAAYGPASLSQTHLCLNIFAPIAIKKEMVALLNRELR